jgi:nucleotide-binding universal stress UspA family protein
MNKILCPIDFSSTSLNAIEFAVKLGEKHKATLTLLYVFTEEEFNKILDEDTDIKRSFDDLKALAEKKLQGLTSEINKTAKEKGLVQCNYILRVGELIDCILDFAKEDSSKLIVMGTTGVSDITEAFVGSNTVKVIENATCPVLCVPEKAIYKKFTKVVYATDYQQEDKAAIQKLIVFGEVFDSRIQILHVSQSGKLVDKAILEDYKEKIISYVNYPNLEFVIKVYEDEINRGIDEYMIEEKADLLVLLTKQRSFFEKLFHKSITSSMSYFTDYPLLIFSV